MQFDSPGAEVAFKVRAAMAGHRRRQTELATVLHLKQSTVSRKLAGARPFTVEELLAVANFLGLPVTDFLPSEDLIPTEATA